MPPPPPPSPKRPKMLIMISATPGTDGITRTERPFKQLTRQLVLDMILEECFQKSVEDITDEEHGNIDETFDPVMDERNAVWMDPATGTVYSFIII